jgi:hypothetical protein
MAKIVSINPTGQWQDLHKMEVTFDDGQSGTAFSKTPTPWYSVGDEVEYSLNAKGSVKISKGTSGYTSAPKASYGGGSSKDEQIAKSVVFKGAIDLACAGKINVSDIVSFVEKYTPVLTGAAPQGATHAQHFPQEQPF